MNRWRTCQTAGESRQPTSRIVPELSKRFPITASYVSAEVPNRVITQTRPKNQNFRKTLLGHETCWCSMENGGVPRVEGVAQAEIPGSTVWPDLGTWRAFP